MLVSDSGTQFTASLYPLLWALIGTRLNVQYAHLVATRAILADTSLGQTFAMLAAARNVMRSRARAARQCGRPRVAHLALRRFAAARTITMDAPAPALASLIGIGTGFVAQVASEAFVRETIIAGNVTGKQVVTSRCSTTPFRPCHWICMDAARARGAVRPAEGAAMGPGTRNGDHEEPSAPAQRTHQNAYNKTHSFIPWLANTNDIAIGFTLTT